MCEALRFRSRPAVQARSADLATNGSAIDQSKCHLQSGTLLNRQVHAGILTTNA